MDTLQTAREKSRNILRNSRVRDPLHHKIVINSDNFIKIFEFRTSSPETLEPA